MKTYAGVGSRETPEDILHLMKWAAVTLAAAGWVLRSGHADGADAAFEEGAAGRAQIYLPWEHYNSETPVQGWSMPYPDALAVELASEVHPAWYRMGGGGHKLHGRNMHIVLGPHLSDPVSYVLCWTEEAKRRGGTATTIRLAERRQIPVFNLWHNDVQQRIEDMVYEYLDKIC